MAVRKEQLKADLKSCISNLKDRADVIEGTVDQPLRDILIQENAKNLEIVLDQPMIKTLKLLCRLKMMINLKMIY